MSYVMTNRLNVGAVFGLALVLTACGSSDTTMMGGTGAIISAGTGGMFPGGTGGALATGGAPLITTSGGVIGATGGTMAVTGGAATTGGVVAVTGGDATTGGTMGTGGTPGSVTPGGPYIREADPTEQSILGTTTGEYTVQSYTELDGLVGGDKYGAAALAGDSSELYYPTDATPPFAAMVVVPGFTAQRSDVAYWGSFLASHGIATLVIDTNNTGDQPDVRSAALVDALESLKKENMRSGSPVEGNLDTTSMGVMGWSMGGGGTWITADSHPELKVAVSLCGWITGSVGSSTQVPSMQLAVQSDPLAAGMSQPVYNAIPASVPKELIEWISADHWYNNNPANENGQVGRYGLSFIKVFLEGDERYRQFLSTTPPNNSDFMNNGI